MVERAGARSGPAEWQNGSGGKQNLALVHARLREAILSGELPPGTTLSQVRLAEKLGVSRTPLREALRLLEREGLVDSETNRRVRVAEFSVSDLEQLYAMRIQLEALAVRLSVPRMGDKELRDLSGHLERMREFAESEDYEGWEEPHRAFHDELVARSGGRLVGTIAQLSDHAERYRRAYMTGTPRSWTTSMEEHRALLMACEAKDPALAAKRLARHYSVVVLGLIASLAPEHDPVAVRTSLRTATCGDGPMGPEPRP